MLIFRAWATCAKSREPIVVYVETVGVSYFDDADQEDRVC